jgi:hypothetical protein
MKINILSLLFFAWQISSLCHSQPTIIAISPAHESDSVHPGTELLVTFDVDIATVSGGEIFLTDLNDATRNLIIPVTDTNQVRVSSAISPRQLRIQPAAPLEFGTTYAVTFSQGFVSDLASPPNLWSDATFDADRWNVSTICEEVACDCCDEDVTAPVITSTEPADDSTSVSPLSSSLTVNFDDIILPGTGNITLHNVTLGTTVATFPVTDASKVSLAGSVLTIRPGVVLPAASELAIRIDAGAVKNVSDLPFAGISDNTTWNFSTDSKVIYTWIQGGVATDWNDPKNWFSGAIPPPAVNNTMIVFGPNTTGEIGETGNKVTLGSLSWGTNFDLRSFGTFSSQLTTGVFINTGTAAPAIATASNGARMSAYYVPWNLDSDLELTGNGKLRIHAANTNGVNGAGGFIVGSGFTLEFDNTHESQEYVYTGGVEVRASGRVDLSPGKSNGALGNGPLSIEETGSVKLVASKLLDNDTTITVTSAGAISANNTIFFTNSSGVSVSGDFVFDLSDAGTTLNHQWRIFSNTPTFLNAFTVASTTAGAWTEISGVWTGRENGATYQFNESTGILSVIPTTGPDTTQPSIVSLSPVNGETGVLRESNLVAKFDEPIRLMSGGTITVTDLTDGSSTTAITLPDARVSSPKGNNLVIKLDSNLKSATPYSIRISADAIEDLSSTPNAFAGIADDITWTFTTEEPDVIPPTIVTVSPVVGNTSVLPWANLTAVFSEAINLTGTGTITLTDLDDGSATQTISLPDPRVTSPNGNDLLIDLVASLDFGTHYSVRISSDAIVDDADVPNAFPEDVVWDFTTKPDAARINNVLLVTIELADALPNRSMEIVENTMFNDATNIDDAFREASYGQMGLHLGDNSGKDPTVEFKYLDTTKAAAGSPGNLRNRANSDLVAMGYNLSNFRFILYIVPGGFNNNAGTAAVGGQWSIYQSFSNQVIMHEMGHCLGGNHSVQDPGCSLGWATWNYAAEKKIRFGWMDAFPGTVTDVASRTSMTLVPLNRSPVTLPGMRIARVAKPGGGVYHISYRGSEEPYSRLSDPAAYSQQVFVSLDSGGTLTSHKATLAAGESFTDGVMTVTCHSVAPDGLSANITIESSAFESDTYATWIAGFGLDPADLDFTDDPDGDGLKNGVEAFFGTNPGEFNAGITNLATGGTITTFTHPQNENPQSDVNGFYEWSPNLTDWYACDGVEGPPTGQTVSVSTDTVDTTVTITATASEPMDSLFLRAGVTQP